MIIHQSFADILDQAAKCIHILCAVQDPCDLPSLLQWSEDSKNIIQFTSKLCASDWVSALERGITV